MKGFIGRRNQWTPNLAHYGSMDYQGFIQRGRGAGITPPPSRNLEIEYGYYCFVTDINNNIVPDFVRSNLRGSKLKIFMREGRCPQTPLVGTHSYVFHTLLSSCYHSIALPPPRPHPQLKILYETLIMPASYKIIIICMQKHNVRIIKVLWKLGDAVILNLS